MNSRQVLQLLQRFESRNVTFAEPDGSWPIVWDRARGCHVWDSEGRRYLDLTGAFGVAAAGHANPRVVAAGKSQMDRLVHAMGDVHPHEPKAKLVRELSRLTFERWTRAGSAANRSCATPASKLWKPRSRLHALRPVDRKSLPSKARIMAWATAPSTPLIESISVNHFETNYASLLISCRSLQKAVARVRGNNSKPRFAEHCRTKKSAHSW